MVFLPGTLFDIRLLNFFFRQFDTNCHKLLCLQGGPCKCIASYGSVSIIHVAIDIVYFVLH
jgi:hypothetical protein